ncbi:acid-sensing ion channel 2-like [Lineus longissimus]|uniref:acid-sensing ion channel 2-like n=1 Tax=Lineus longissimus TaxID=88925 RepID=UPI00315C837F
MSLPLQIPEEKAEKQDFLARLSKYAEETEFHGLRRCMHPDVALIRRLIWFTMVSASFSYFMYGMVNRIKYFQGSPHSTRVDLLYVSKIEFPSVTICNVNSYRLSSLTDDDIYNHGQTLGLLDKDWHLLHREHYDQAFQDRIDAIDWQSYRPAAPDLAEFTKRTGHQIKDMLLMCRWRDEICGPENFTHVFTDYGNCYTFNSGQNGSVLTSKKPGRAHGLNLYLNLEEYDYMNNDQTVHAGFKVLLHQRKEPPLVDELGLGLQPETHYLIAIRKELIINLPEPYGICANNFEMKHYEQYSVAGCRLECTSASVIRNCSCRLLELPDMGSEVPLCSPHQVKTCANPTLEFLMDSDDCVCQTPCNMSKYSMEMSSLKIRHEMVDKLKDMNKGRHTESGINLTDTITSDSLVAINIFYESLNYEIVEQYAAYPSEALFGDVGGQIGLFIGASVLTLAHLAEFIIDELLILWKKMRNQRLLRMAEIPGFRSAAGLVPGITNRTPNGVPDGFRGSMSVLSNGIGIYKPGTGPMELKVNGHDMHIVENTHAVIEAGGDGITKLPLTNYPSQLSLDPDGTVRPRNS